MGCRRGYARGLLDSLASLHSISSWWRIISIDYAWGLISRDYSSLGFVLRMALSQDCLDDAMDPSHGAEDSQDWFVFFSNSKFLLRVLGQCVWHAGWPGSGVHMCVCLCLFNRITCRFSSLTIWFEIYIYLLYYMYIYVYRIYIYILLFSSVLHNSLYVKFHLFQPQDAWLHEFGDPKADSGLCVHFCFCWLGPLLKCFLFGFWVQCFFQDCLAILLLITFPCFSGFRPIKATKMIRRRQLTWSTSLCICFWCANC